MTTTYHSLGGLNSRSYFFSVFRIREVQAQGVSSFSWHLSPWPVSGHSFHVSSHGLPLLCVCVLVSALKDTSPLGFRSTLIISSCLNQLFKDPISEYSHTLRYQGLGLQHVDFENTVHPMHACLLSPSVMSDSSQPCGRSPPSSSGWDSPGKNTEVGCYALLQGIFPTDYRSNQQFLHCRQILASEPPGNLSITIIMTITK